MSKTDDTSDRCFAFVGKSDLVIGSQGTGSIDFPNSDVNLVPLRQISRIKTLEEARLDGSQGVPSIRMKAGVKPFNIHYDYNSNLLLVRPDIRHLIEDGGSVNAGCEVDCVFGKKDKRYIGYNLLNYFVCDHAVDWTASRFMAVENSDFQIGMTRVGRGELPASWKPEPVASNIVCTDWDDYRETPKSYPLCWLVPDVLTILSTAEAKIVNFTSVMTLVRDDLAQSLSQDREAGMVFLKSRVSVAFNHGGSTA